MSSITRAAFPRKFEATLCIAIIIGVLDVARTADEAFRSAQFVIVRIEYVGRRDFKLALEEICPFLASTRRWYL